MNKRINGCVLVCATGRNESKRLIAVGKKYADKDGLNLQVVNIRLPDSQKNGDFTVLSKLYEEAKRAGAEMTVYFNDEAVLVTAAHAVKYNAVRIITGLPGENSSDFIAQLRMLIPDRDFSLVDESSNVYQIPARVPARII